jgi:hypothetical protein
MVPFPQASPPKPCAHLSAPPYAPHAQPISLLLFTITCKYVSPSVLGKLLYFGGSLGLAKQLTVKVAYNFILRLSWMWSHIFWYKTFRIFSRFLLRGRRTWQVPTEHGYLTYETTRIHMPRYSNPNSHLLENFRSHIYRLYSTFEPSTPPIRFWFTDKYFVCFFWAWPKNCGKRLLSSSHSSVRPSARLHRTTWHPRNFVFEILEIMSRKFQFH